MCVNHVDGDEVEERIRAYRRPHHHPAPPPPRRAPRRGLVRHSFAPRPRPPRDRGAAAASRSHRGSPPQPPRPLKLTLFLRDAGQSTGTLISARTGLTRHSSTLLRSRLNTRRSGLPRIFALLGLLLRSRLLEPSLNGSAGKLARGIGGDPTRRRRSLRLDTRGARQCRLVQSSVALTDLPHRPTDGLLDIVAFVGGLALGQFEEFKERLVGSILVVDGEIGDQRKRGR